MFDERSADGSNSSLIHIGRWVGSVADPDFIKQDDRHSAARPHTDISNKLLEQGIEIPPRQAAADRPEEDQLKGAQVLALDSATSLSLGARRDGLSMACWIRITLPLSGRQGSCVGASENSWWPVHSRGWLDSHLRLVSSADMQLQTQRRNHSQYRC